MVCSKAALLPSSAASAVLPSCIAVAESGSPAASTTVHSVVDRKQKMVGFVGSMGAQRAIREVIVPWIFLAKSLYCVIKSPALFRSSRWMGVLLCPLLRSAFSDWLTASLI